MGSNPITRRYLFHINNNFRAIINYQIIQQQYIYFIFRVRCPFFLSRMLRRCVVTAVTG
jgi:hypothetical protein